MGRLNTLKKKLRYKLRKIKLKKTACKLRLGSEKNQSCRGPVVTSYNWICHDRFFERHKIE